MGTISEEISREERHPTDHSSPADPEPLSAIKSWSMPDLSQVDVALPERDPLSEKLQERELELKKERRSVLGNQPG